MSSAHPQPITISGDAGLRVSGLLQTPPGARACYVLAHGAGAGMDHPFMAAVAAELAPRGIATLRYQFPAMERGARATLKLFRDADHSFHVPARTGRTDAQVRGEMLDALAAWIDGLLTIPAPAR